MIKPNAAHGGFLVRIFGFGGSTQGPNWAVFLPPWPWWAPGGTSHQVGWPGEARGSRGGAPGGAALTFAPGRAAGAVFFQGGALGDKWLDRTGAACQSWARKI